MQVQAYDRTKTTLLDTGVFASLDNQIDTTTGTVKAKARFNNTRLQLFPSQFVNVRLQVRTIRDAVVVPVSAVRPSGTGEFVFVLQQDHTVKQRPVVRGQPLGPDRVQIVSGLNAGDRVITEGADRLRDGSRVILPGESPSAGGFGGGGGGRHRRNGAEGAGGPASAAGTAASGTQPPATNPFIGASAAQGPNGVPGLGPTQRQAGNGRYGQPAAMGAPGEGTSPGPTVPPSGPGADRWQNLTPEQRAARAAEWEQLTPEQRAERRKQRQQQSAGGTPNQ
jgi:multidrug efflux system membrane fusion protein